MPGSADTVSFSAGVLTLDANVTVGALVLGAEGTLTGADTTLTVLGNLTLNAEMSNANEHLFASSGNITVYSLGATDLFAPAGTSYGLWDNDTGTAHWINQSGATFTLHDNANQR